MQLSPKQRVALSDLRGAAKQALLAVYHKQNAQKQPVRGAPARRQARRSNARLQSMPAAQSAPRGEMPSNANNQTWSQTPATSNIVAPRGFGYYDAFSNDAYSAATHMSIGPATPIVANTICATDLVTIGKQTLQVPLPGGGTQSLEAGMKLLVIYPATCDTQAKLFGCTGSDPNGLAAEVPYNSPNLMASNPDNAIPTRCSFRIRNWTQHIGTGGIVRTLRCTTGLSLDCSSVGRTTNADLALLCEEIRNHTRTRVYSGEELCESHQKNCSVVDQSKSTWFTDWNAHHEVSDVPWARDKEGWPQKDDTQVPPAPYTIGTFSRQLHDPAYTPIVVLFEPFTAAVNGIAVGNHYEVNIRSQFLAHYAQGTMLANMAIAPKHDTAGLNRHKDREEATGSMLHKIGDLVSGAAHWAWGHRGMIAAGAAGAGRYLAAGSKALPMLL